METDKIIHLEKGKQRIIDMLERHLEMATAGTLKCCMVVSLTTESVSHASYAKIEGCTDWEMLGVLRHLNHQIEHYAFDEWE